MARSTRVSAAVNRLRERSNNAPYSMVTMADGRFYLILANGDDEAAPLNEPMEMDEFVAFVNSIQKLAPKKASKLDIAFEAKLQASKNK
jgi:crotonobetainyl-CoA:carnitine CoA-transferase CaiB-like acyl-CoA transferase